MPDHAPHATPVDVELAGGETLTFGGVRIEALGTPGHTPGSICYLMERDGLRVLFAGDVISMLRGDENPLAEVRKPLGTYSAYLSPRYRGDARAYLASLRALKALPVPDLVVPGHPSSDPSPQSPSMTLPEWQALLDRGVRDMETLVGRYETDGADFLDGNPKRLLPDLYYLGDFGGNAVYALVAASKLYLVNAPGGPEGQGLSAFVETRLESLGVSPRSPAGVLLTSCDPKSAAGLKGLIEASHVKVVAGVAGVEGVKSLCPPGTVVLPADELSGQGWFTVLPVALRGRGQAPTAYVVPWAGKTVLFTGLIPSGLGVGAQEALAADLAGSREDALEYLVALTALADLEPNLWLPAVPSDDQNANLYDHQWKETVAENSRAAYQHLRRQR
jgi:glyoxylase-like metal-dependent hydrolase (beta-lactamase superfamily II)